MKKMITQKIEIEILELKNVVLKMFIGSQIKKEFIKTERMQI